MSAVLRQSADDTVPNGPEGAPEPVDLRGALPELGEILGRDVLRSLEASVQSTLENGLAAGALTVQLPVMAEVASAADWTNTLSLVERAAATIRSYEKRYLHLERQSRLIADRAAEDHHRMMVQIQSLEDRLKRAEARATAAETAARDAEYEEWEAEARAKRLEQRATEAEARATQAEAYLRRVHDLLSAV